MLHLQNLLVMKFGGTSMGSAERIQVAAEICAEQKSRRPLVVVVSAMSRITDLLLEAMRHAASGDAPALEAHLQKLQDRHVEACHELLPADKREAVLEDIRSLVADFQRLSNGMLMLGHRPARSMDEAVAIGERLSALLLASYLEHQGVRALAVNAADVVVTDAAFGNASPLMEETRARARQNLAPWIESGVLPVVTGFNGATADGRPTTLGRGGSDFSASILASALDASELWIWTDVDGILSADPRIVADAAVLPEVTYSEAAELAYNGAKVLHPRTLAPLEESKIPVWSKNSFARHKPGTRIVDRLQHSRPGARAVTSTAKVAMVSIEPASSAVTGAQVMARSMDALARADVEVLALSSSSFRQSFCFLVRTEELRPALEGLQGALSLELTHGYLHPIEVEENVGLLAIVGEGMRGSMGLAGRIFTAISRAEVNIIAIAQGSSELTISVVVRKDGLEKAVRAVHAECGMANL